MLFCIGEPQEWKGLRYLSIKILFLEIAIGLSRTIVCPTAESLIHAKRFLREMGLIQLEFKLFDQYNLAGIIELHVKADNP